MPTKQPRLALVMNERVKEKIKHLADKHGRSTSAEIVVAVEDWIERHPEEMSDFVSNEPPPTPEEQAEIDRLIKEAQRKAFDAVMAKRSK